MTLYLVFLLIPFFYLLFWRFDHFGKAPYKKLFVCMYVATLEIGQSAVQGVSPKIVVKNVLLIG